MEVSEESFRRYQATAKAAQEKILELSRDLEKAAKTINDQKGLIEKLSQDNLKLVAKLDELTGKKAPGNTYSA